MAKHYYTVEFVDHRSGARSAIDRIEAGDGYTAEQYIADCESNADDAWNEMLAHGTVYILREER